MLHNQEAVVVLRQEVMSWKEVKARLISSSVKLWSSLLRMQEWLPQM